MIRPRVARVKGGASRQMDVMAYLFAYLACILVMGGLDFLWLSNTSALLYQRDLGPLLAEDPNMTVAVIFYLIYITGVLIFAVRPALADGDWRTAGLYGALFGFFAYATYDLTNFATLKVWSLRVTLLDIAWGVILTSALSLRSAPG